MAVQLGIGMTNLKANATANLARHRSAPLAILIAGWLVLSLSAESGADRVSAAKRIAEQFCLAEFEGDDLSRRENLIRFSPEREAELKKKKAPIAPIVLNWRADALFVVASCRVESIEVHDRGAVATIVYRRLARQYDVGEQLPLNMTVGYLPKLVPDYKENDAVRVNLVDDGKRWWVVDPPLPRVSKDVLIKGYENSKICFDVNWIAQASEEQRQVCTEQQEILKELRALPN
jgi:hypothetical protein